MGFSLVNLFFVIGALAMNLTMAEKRNLFSPDMLSINDLSY
jgi:hypothetical protein